MQGSSAAQREGTPVSLPRTLSLNVKATESGRLSSFEPLFLSCLCEVLVQEE